MARIVFYCNDTRTNIEAFEYYQQDIEALRALGHEVFVCTRYREIPSRFDAMFVWWWTYALWPVLLCRLLGRPCLITGVYNFRNPPAFEGMDYFRRPLWQRLLIQTATRLCSLNLFIDRAESLACAQHFALTNAREYPCILHEDYVQGPSEARTLTLFNLAWSGRGNLIRKGIPDLLEAIRLLKSEGNSVRLYQGGKRGDGASYLEKTVGELGIEEEVTLLGELTRAEKIDLLRKCELYVQPSHYEGFGLATAEAMGCGACIITCDVGAVRSVVGDSGLYVTPGAPRELADAIKRVISDSALRQRLQAAAFERARAMFRVEAKRGRLSAYLAEVGIT